MVSPSRTETTWPVKEKARGNSYVKQLTAEAERGLERLAESLAMLSIALFLFNLLPIPALAESWDVNDDFTQFTFHIRRNGRWSNGDPVTAEDFRFSFHRILQPELGALYSYMLWPIRNAEARRWSAMTRWLAALSPLALTAVSSSDLAISVLNRSIS